MQHKVYIFHPPEKMHIYTMFRVAFLPARTSSVVLPQFLADKDRNPTPRPVSTAFNLLRNKAFPIRNEGIMISGLPNE